MDKIAQLLDNPYLKGREFLVTCTREEFLALPGKLEDASFNQVQRPLSDSLKGFGSPSFSVEANGTTIHFKINPDLK